MGLYVEVPRKIDWFHENLVRFEETSNGGGYSLVHGAGQVDLAQVEETLQDDEFICCLVDNGHFYALAVCFHKEELEGFNQRDDRRNKCFARFKKSTLKPVCPNWDNYIGG